MRGRPVLRTIRLGSADPSLLRGLLLALLGVVLEGWASLAALTAVLTLWALACVAASYRYSRCEKGGESEYSDHS